MTGKTKIRENEKIGERDQLTSRSHVLFRSANKIAPKNAVAGANSNVNHIHATLLIVLALSQNQGNPLSRQCHEYEMAVRFTGRIPKNITSRPTPTLSRTSSDSEKLPDGPCLAKPMVVTITAQEMITGTTKNVPLFHHVKPA
jgi:hypothetical protein